LGHPDAGREQLRDALSGGEGSEAAAEEGSGSADDGSGIPPGMPEEGSPAYERLESRLCKELAPEIWGMGQSAMHSCSVVGGFDGAPRTLEAHHLCGSCNEGCFTTWTEQLNGSWEVSESGVRGEVVNEQPTLRPDVESGPSEPVAQAQALWWGGGLIVFLLVGTAVALRRRGLAATGAKVG
jgi:hypothetical protein